MTATYNTVTIDGVEYDVYADVATADAYLAAESGATDWRAETDDEVKGRALVTATRLIDRQVWPGSKTDDDQVLAWPRTGTGLTDVDEDVIPQAVIDAACVLAMLIVAGVDVTGTASTTSNRVKRQKAGSVEQEFFADYQTGGTRLPLQVHELLMGLYGGTIVGGARAQGTDECSHFRYDYSPGAPL